MPPPPARPPSRLARLAGAAALACALALGSCSSPKPVAPYPLPGDATPLGPRFDAATGAATFAVWAPAAGSVSILLYDAWDAGSPSASVPLAKDLASGGPRLDASGWNGVWTGTASGLRQGQLYLVGLDGRPALDPFAPSLGLNGGSGAKGALVDVAAISPVDLQTGSAVAVVPFDRPAGYARRTDAAIYEVHVRDFTILEPRTPLGHAPGSYLAFAERLSHVRDLGMTHVQLLPVLAYKFGDERRRNDVERAQATRDQNYNWGYDPLSWFAPAGMYSEAAEDPVARVRELKTLVNEAHRLGLGVTLDVVYNHTAEKAVLEPFAPGYFYRAQSFTGVGNDTASDHLLVRRLIVESVRHWTAAYGVDGFRFDLMGILDSRTMTLAHAAAAAVKPDVLFIGEGWRMGGVPGTDEAGNRIEAATQDWMDSTDDVASFSDSFRDLMKGGGFGEGDSANSGFLTSQGPFNSTPVDRGLLLRNLRGDATNFTADDPGDAVQYLTAHDGLTLHDKIAKVLAQDPRDPAQEAVVQRVARLGHALQATAQGILFVHGGCEMGRTKRVDGALPETTPGNAIGVNYVQNSYDSSDAVNGFAWAAWYAPGTEGRRTADYLRGLLALRRSTDAFRLGSRAEAAARVVGLDLTNPYAIAFKATDRSSAHAYFVFANAGTSAVQLQAGEDVGAAEVLVDDDEAGATPVAAPTGFARSGATVTLQPRTAVILRK